MALEQRPEAGKKGRGLDICWKVFQAEGIALALGCPCVFVEWQGGLKLQTVCVLNCSVVSDSSVTPWTIAL